MSDSSAFEAICTYLEESSSLDRLSARGTIRLVLKQAGLEPKTVTPTELGVVVKKLLPAELRARDVADPDALCDRIAHVLRGLDGAARTDTPDAIFARLASR